MLPRLITLIVAATLVTTAAHPIDEWMRSHPRVAEHATWRDANGTRPYDRWPSGMRERLQDIFDALRAGRPAPMADPVPNAARTGPPDREYAQQWLAPDIARDVYLSFVAQTLLVEIEHRVDWSIAGYDDESLDALVASRAFFYWRADRGLYEITQLEHGFATPAPPTTAFAFLRDQAIVARSRRDTIVNLVDWSARLTHFAGGYDRSNIVDHWHYDGAMPVSRLIDGTIYSGQPFAQAFGGDRRHFTAGCHGTAGFFLTVLRAVNIPVIVRGVGTTTTHATLIFPADDLAMSHGDDPYTRTTNRVSAADRLIDRATYDRWLGPLAPDPDRYVGYQPKLVDARITRERGAGWIEAESSLPRGSGVVEPQDMSGFSGDWHGGAQVLWHDARIGDELSWSFDVAVDNARSLDVALTRAVDYAIVSLSLDGRALRGGERVDLFSPDVRPFELTLTDVAIPRGRHTLTVKILGADPAAVPALMVGLDAIRVR
jgi:hypothetical protein